MTKSGKIVKLVVYRYANEEIIVDTIKAKDWGDFLIVGVKMNQMTPELYEQMRETFGEYSKQMNKEVILVPEEMDIEFYGVEVDE